MANSLEVQSLHRAFDILEAIGSSTTPVGLKQITEMTGLPKSTVYRLLSNLESRNYITCDHNSTYRLGLQLLKLNQLAEKDFEIKNVARGFLESLNAFTKETVHLAMLDKNRVLYVDTVESPHALRLVAKLGTTNSVHCTALGKALLIGHSDSDIEKILREQGMDVRTEYTLTTPESYLTEMRIVRQTGYALDDRESELEGRCIGAPIYNRSGEVIAAISISGLAARFAREFIEKEVVHRLLEATHTISKTFGYTV
ncbi:MAG: IclR family transcriptional regulator [Sporomusaceae bacterium]|nr:IclR family transcriptional regulator [Sporomusaceae bacterium]